MLNYKHFEQPEFLWQRSREPATCDMFINTINMKKFIYDSK
jgi:hypothetical protein